MELKVDDVIANLIKKKNIRITNQRKKVIEILIENKDKHMSIEDIYSVSKEKNSMLAIATIYRTMNFLEKTGIVIKNHFDEGVKYELYIKEKGNHSHLICKRCGRIIELFGLLPDDLENKLAEEKEFKYEEHCLDIYGYCKDCIEQMKGT